MKQKMVVKVTMNGDKSRTKALQIAVGFSGVESASLKGDDKSQIEVTGVDVDPVKLTSRLRKSVGHADLVSLIDADKKEEEKPGPPPPEFVWTTYNPPCHWYSEPQYGYVLQHEHEPSCSIM